MKRVAMSVVVLSFLFLGLTAQANSSYKKSSWASKLVNGVLQVQGPGYGSWAKTWVTVDSGVLSYQEVGTSLGPVLIYALKNKTWRVVQLKFDTGARQNVRNFPAQVTLMRGGQYGALIQSANICYDYSWDKLNRIDCKTTQFK